MGPVMARMVSSPRRGARWRAFGVSRASVVPAPAFGRWRASLGFVDVQHVDQGAEAACRDGVDVRDVDMAGEHLRDRMAADAHTYDLDATPFAGPDSGPVACLVVSVLAIGQNEHDPARHARFRA